MTNEKAKKLLKIGKWVVAIILAIFFVIIIVQSVQINSLTNRKDSLTNSLETKQEQNSNLESEIDFIEKNKDSYSESELRKDNYKKNDEEMIKSK